MKVLRSEILMLPSLIFWKFNGINLEFKHTWQMLDLAPALPYTNTFLEQQCYSFQCFAICCYSISCLSWAGSHKKTYKPSPSGSIVYLLVQRYAKHANEIKWDQMSRKTNDQGNQKRTEGACFLRDQRPNILCAGASKEYGGDRPVRSLCTWELRAKKRRLDWVDLNLSNLWNELKWLTNSYNILQWCLLISSN